MNNYKKYLKYKYKYIKNYNKYIKTDENQLNGGEISDWIQNIKKIGDDISGKIQDIGNNISGKIQDIGDNISEKIKDIKNTNISELVHTQVKTKLNLTESFTYNDILNNDDLYKIDHQDEVIDIPDIYNIIYTNKNKLQVKMTHKILKYEITSHIYFKNNDVYIYIPGIGAHSYIKEHISLPYFLHSLFSIIVQFAYNIIKHINIRKNLNEIKLIKLNNLYNLYISLIQNANDIDFTIDQCNRLVTHFEQKYKYTDENIKKINYGFIKYLLNIKLDNNTSNNKDYIEYRHIIQKIHNIKLSDEILKILGIQHQKQTDIINMITGLNDNQYEILINYYISNNIIIIDDIVHNIYINNIYNVSKINIIKLDERIINIKLTEQDIKNLKLKNDQIKYLKLTNEQMQFIINEYIDELKLNGIEIYKRMPNIMEYINISPEQIMKVNLTFKQIKQANITIEPIINLSLTQDQIINLRLTQDQIIKIGLTSEQIINIGLTFGNINNIITSEQENRLELTPDQIKKLNLDENQIKKLNLNENQIKKINIKHEQISQLNNISKNKLFKKLILDSQDDIKKIYIIGDSFGGLLSVHLLFILKYLFNYKRTYAIIFGGLNGLPKKIYNNLTINNYILYICHKRDQVTKAYITFKMFNEQDICLPDFFIAFDNDEINKYQFICNRYYKHELDTTLASVLYFLKTSSNEHPLSNYEIIQSLYNHIRNTYKNNQDIIKNFTTNCSLIKF